MISIIIPAYNEAQYILSTIQSIPRTEVKDLEVIVVSDASTDTSAELAKKHVDLVVQLPQRLGPGGAKHAGAHMAKGDILVFLDADTRLSKGILSEISQRCQDYSVGTCRISPDSPKLKHQFCFSIKNIFCRIFGISNGIIFCTKKTYLEEGGFSLGKGEDGILLRSIKRKGKFIFLKKSVISSVRRFEKKGYLSVLWYWVKEKYKPSADVYDAIR